MLCGHDHDYERSYPVRGCNHRAGADRQPTAQYELFETIVMSKKRREK